MLTLSSFGKVSNFDLNASELGRNLIWYIVWYCMVLNFFFHSKFFLLLSLSLYKSEEHAKLAVADSALGTLRSNEFCANSQGVSSR
jgi:hypothetical protein